MRASNLKNIYGLLGKPVASSTPMKGIFDTDFPKVKQKSIRNNKVHCSESPKSANIPKFNVMEYNLEIVSSESDSDSDSMPTKKARISSSKVNQSSATSSVNNVGKKKILGDHLATKSRKTARNTIVAPPIEKNDDLVIPADRKKIANKKPKPHKRLETSSENSDVNVKVVNHKDRERAKSKTLTKTQEPRQRNSQPTNALVKNTEKAISFDSNPISPKKKLQKDTKSSKMSQSSDVIDGRAGNKPKINSSGDHESSSDESGRASRANEQHDRLKGRKPRVKKNNLSQKSKMVSISPEKPGAKKLSSSSENSQKRVTFSEDGSKKIVTPLTEMPPARPRESVCRTLSRISASAMGTFMVEIPKNLADSFSASLQLVKRRIDFEGVDKSEKPRNNVDAKAESTTSRDKPKKLDTFNEEKDEHRRIRKQRRLLISPPETEAVPRQLTALASVCSSEEKTTENKSNAALNGIRRSSRTRIPPISYWMGNGTQETNQLFAQNQIKKTRNTQTSSTSHQSKQDSNWKKSTSLRASMMKDDVKRLKKVQPSKSVQWEDIRRKNLNDTDVANEFKVCSSTFDKTVFLPADDDEDGEESGVLYAESLKAHNVQSEFLRLSPGAETTDLLTSDNYKLYTVLENTVCLHAEGEQRQFGLHSQFYVRKGVSHKLQNNSDKASLLLQVIIK